MREILFKAKRKDDGEWVTGDLIRDTGDTFIGRDETINGGYTRCVYYSVDLETVCQFTGLRDRNKERVFEGDILSFDDGSLYDYIVIWGHTGWCYRLKRGNKIGTSFNEIRKSELLEQHITGNIHDGGEE